MKKPILITLLCAGLMLITPFTVVAQENKITANIVEEPDDIEGLVAQIRVVIDEILQKYEHIPLISNFGNLILNLLASIGLLLYTFIFIISILIDIVALILAIFVFYNIPLFLAAFVLDLITELDRNCPTIWDLIPPPIKSIYTQSVTNDITNLAKGCSCLQE